MATSHPRPDLAAYAEAVAMHHAELVGALRGVLGAKLVVYLGGVNETRIIRRWAEGSEEIDSEVVVERLRIAYRAARLITDRESDAVVQAWFQGMNPNLDDKSLAQVLRDVGALGDWPCVLATARQFVV